MSMCRLAGAALVAVQVVAQQNPHETWWEESMGIHYCPGGQAWSSTAEACVACVEGKQSRHNSTMPCSFCPQTLMPNADQNGCVCQPLHFNVWASSAGAHNELLQCTPCADVLVALAHGDEVTGNKNAGKTPCQPCDDASSGRCAEGIQCECAGGPKGDARLCPVDGFWLEYRGQANLSIATFNRNEPMPDDRQQRAATFEMLQCSPPLDGKSSKCLHWSRCLEQADVGAEDDDPVDVQRAKDAGIAGVYVSDSEYESWKAVAGPDYQNCGADSWSPYRIGLEDSHIRVPASGPNCCMPGYTGRICEECIPPMLKIDGRCIKCKDVNYFRLVTGTVLTLVFILWMMRKSVLPFKDCNGKASIVVFFLQTVQLLFKGRTPELFDILSNAVDFNFYGHTTTSCTIPMGYYTQFFVDLFSGPVSMAIVYLVVVMITFVTSHTVEIHSYATQTVESATRVTLVVKTLGKMDAFKMLSTEDRHVLARMLSLRWFQPGEDILVEGDVPDGKDGSRDEGEFYIICKGEVAVKIKDFGTEDGLSHQVRKLTSGEWFGDIALVVDGPRTATVTALDRVECVSLSRIGFAELQSKFTHNDEFMRMFKVAKGRVKCIKDAVDLQLGRGVDGVALAYGPHRDQKNDTSTGDTRAVDESQRKFVNLYRTQDQERANERVRELELRIAKNRCCKVLQIHELIHDELIGIYHACINPTARLAAILEISIYLYGPVTLQAMQVLFCKNVNGVSYPVREPSISCETDTHQKVQAFAACFLVTVMLGVIWFMYVSADRFHGALAADPNKAGLQLAKELCGERWNSMSFSEQKKEVERCAHRLRVQILGQECFMVSTLQMSVNQECAQWYPQWHLLRRTLLNWAYMAGLARGGKLSPLFWQMDWRVVVMAVLCISSTLQYHFRPFRDDLEDRLEMWGLQFIMIMVVVDFGHDNSSEPNAGYVSAFALAVILTVIFLLVAAKDWGAEFRRGKRSKTEWDQIRAWYDHNDLNKSAVRAKRDELDAAQDAAQDAKPTEQFTSPWDSKKSDKVEEEYLKFSNPMLNEGDKSPATPLCQRS